MLILKFRIGFLFDRDSALTKKSVVQVLGICVASGVDTEFPYQVRIVDRGLIAATLFADTVSASQVHRNPEEKPLPGGTVPTENRNRSNRPAQKKQSESNWGHPVLKKNLASGRKSEGPSPGALLTPKEVT